MRKTPAKTIFISVLVLHLSLALIGKNTHKKKLPPNKVTITYSSYSTPPPPKKVLQKKVTQKTVQKKTPRKASKKRVIKKKRPDNKAALSLEKAIKNLNFENSFQAKGENLQIPKTSIEFEIIKVEANVKKETIRSLIQTLKEHLILPERGAVKLKITFNSEGRAISTEIISSKSKKNADYLKNRLPELSFPCFNHCIEGETSLEFLFRNEQN